MPETKRGESKQGYAPPRLTPVGGLDRLSAGESAGTPGTDITRGTGP
jgi:hypothetical protein